MKFYLAARLTIVALTLILASACNATTSPAPNQPSSSTLPGWFIDPDSSNIAIITLDFQTLDRKGVYFTRQEPCDRHHPAINDEEIAARVGDIFRATQAYWSGKIDVSRVADFVISVMPPSDFGGFAASHPCSGLVLYAGSIVWSGRGEQIYPAIPIHSNALQHTAPPALPLRVSM